MKTLILILIGVALALSIQPPSEVAEAVEPPPVYQEVNDYYEVDGKFYSLGNIVMAVARREGSSSCGIRLGGQYVKLSRDEGLRLCYQKLGKQLERDSFDRTLRRWKTGSASDNSSATQKYLIDIKHILANQ